MKALKLRKKLSTQMDNCGIFNVLCKLSIYNLCQPQSINCHNLSFQDVHNVSELSKMESSMSLKDESIVREIFVLSMRHSVISVVI
jgi:hypothetical protein